jgi:hypothetical protein
MVTSLEVDANDCVCGVTTYFGITFPCKAAVLTTGTFMNGQASFFSFWWVWQVCREQLDSSGVG